MSLSANVSEKAALIWAIADKLTGVYKPHEYGEVILPLTVIRRFDCILADTKDAVLEKFESVKNLPMRDVLLRNASGKAFYNTSKFTFERLLDDPDNIEANFRDYLNGFSENVQDILEKFKFDGQITTMANKGILYIVIKEFTTPKANLHPDVISNLEMGYIFEEIIRRFSESHNEDAGQHYTPREVIQLMVNILFYDDNDILPPAEKAVAMTDYLDRKCSQIDAIIDRQQEVIEKLKAYKLSIITEAVTKGLNSDVPMKDSGVEWIGEIPEYWQLSHIGNLVEMGSGGTPDRKKPEYWENGNIPWMSSGEINDEYMIVTPSRLHAVRYLLEFKRQIKEKGYIDLDVLVAFSGEVEDNGETYTEEKLNKTKSGEAIKEKALPEAFHTDEYGMLIVAEKYQTGFDEPLLHTMFVDKKLSGVKAVQTLSRLNRTMRGKKDTFVLDFVNSAEDIRKAFEPYYEETVLEEETDPNVVYDLKNTLDEYRVYQQIEIDRFAEIFYSSKEQSGGDLGKLQGTIRPALDRFEALEEEKQEPFKSTLARFNRIYAFITQVCRLFDREIHKFSVYAKFLYTMLPKGGRDKVYVDDKVLLEYYRLEKDFEGGIQLESTPEGFRPITGEAGRREKKRDPLTVIIEKINEKYGTNFTEMDKVLLQMENDYAAQDKWHSYAQNNDRKTFMLLFEKDFPNMAAARYEQNEDFFVKMFSDPDMMRQVMETVGTVLYERLRGQKE